MSDYHPIPVEAAKEIAAKFSRDIVIICAWSHEYKLLHTTTYGVSPADKVYAANGGERCAEALMTDLAKADFSEDFRADHDAAREAAMTEAIANHLPALKKMAGQVIHPKENVFSKMVRDLELAIAKAP